MKKFFLFFIAFIALAEVHAQGWQELGIGSHALKANQEIASVCTDSGGIVYAAGSFTDSVSDTSGTSYVAKWDGTNWSILGNDTSMLNAFGEISSICVDVAHNLYAAIYVNDTNRNSQVMKWDGVRWSELSTGINALNPNSDIESVCMDAAGNVYAAGSFTDSVSDLKGHRYVAKWDGSAWSELGTGSNALNANQPIRSIIADKEGNIYAAGDFYIPGSLSLPGRHYYVAVWNGTTWSQLGTGSNALNANMSIWTLATDPAGNIYAGGFFTDTNRIYYVAKWDGTTWSELNTGSNALDANGAIISICTDMAGNVYAGGNFKDTAGKTYVAKWDHATGAWSELGTGSNRLNTYGDQINVICLDAMANVYAAGDLCDDNAFPECHRYVAEYRQPNTNVIPIDNDTNNIIIYPNPSNEYIHITGADAGNYKMIDMYGKLVLFGETHIGNSSIDISGLPQGVYLLQIGNESGRVFKIVKE